MKLRTMQQLETDMAQHELTRMAKLVALAVAANDADAAALFAVSAVRASRQLDAPEHGAELQAEPMLRRMQNADNTVRWSNLQYAEAAIAAGGVLIIRKAA